MNKLIIAGNGFDLAHGLPTSYNHFMDAFWRDLKDDYKDDLVKKMVYVNELYTGILEYQNGSFKSFNKDLFKYSNEYGYNRNTNNFSVTTNNGKEYIFSFKNDFFRELNRRQSIQNWVDVENEYYKKLKVISKLDSLNKQEKRTQVLQLHKEFEHVKQLLERYLQKNIVEVYDFENDNERVPFYNISYPIGMSDYHEKTLKEFSSKEDKQSVKTLLDGFHEHRFKGSDSYILNFNYTPTFLKYTNTLLDSDGFPEIKINHIHGKLNENIVFGFGDEMDEDYKLIEDMDDNEYLKYFKSFQYSQNSNYKDVLRYIDSEKFQVIIMGHSCGLSDRVLLNTIFEHDNCRSIKVYYYKNGEYDNYTEIVQNISRHFNDKKLMRTKIVEKTLCEPMPQIQLPKKK